MTGGTYNRCWDWGFIGLGITDLDGLIERNGCFLVLEAKGPGVQMLRGQERALRALAAIGRRFVVVVVEGHAPSEVHSWSVMGHEHLGGTGFESLRKFVREWFDWASLQSGLSAKAGRQSPDAAQV